MLVALTSLLRHLPRFFRHTPKTPLRVLGIVAFDTLHVLRHSRPLSPGRADALASFMDFEGCANAACDGKPYCEADYRTILTRLDEAGLAECVRSYLQRLRELENGRPAVPGDLRRVMEVRAYREAVARLSMGTAAVIALTADPVDEGSHSTSSDRDVDALYRVLMQCQIIDDVLDYRQDVCQASSPRPCQFPSPSKSPGRRWGRMRQAACLQCQVRYSRCAWLSPSPRWRQSSSCGARPGVWAACRIRAWSGSEISQMSKKRISTWVALPLVGIGLLIAFLLGINAYMHLTAVPLHPDPAQAPSVTHFSPARDWTAATEEARQIARANLSDQNLPGLSIAVGVGGELVWAEGFGFACLTRDPLPDRDRLNSADLRGRRPAARKEPAEPRR
jgi:hypothetical protein